MEEEVLKHNGIESNEGMGNLFGSLYQTTKLNRTETLKYDYFSLLHVYLIQNSSFSSLLFNNE